MPYIKQELRNAVNQEVAALAIKIESEFSEPSRAGALNYSITGLLNLVYGRALNYADYNEIIGVLECCKLEFYRAQVAPYEDVKRKENGEV